MKNDMTNDGTRKDQDLERELGALRNRYDQLKEQKVRTEQNVANLTAQLDELERQAVAEYGTADPAELEKLLEERRQANERLVAEYRLHIQEIQAGLSQVERGVEEQG